MKNKRLKETAFCAFLLIFLLAFASCAQNEDKITPPDGSGECTEHTDANLDEKCDSCGAYVKKPTKPECTLHLDIEGDGICNICGEKTGGEVPPCYEHIDTDENGSCDSCGADVPKQTPPECTEHKDSNGDEKCDSCGADVPKQTPPECIEHTDANFDGKCDSCGENVPLPTYTLTVSQGTGYYVTSGASQTVRHGESASFKIELMNSKDIINVICNGKILIGDSGTYTVNNITADTVITVEVIKNTEITVNNAIILAEGATKAAAIILKEHLGIGYNSYNMSDFGSNAVFHNCIIVGSNRFETEFQNESIGEEYLIKGDGRNIYIDGNCERALLYGAYDFLRELGFEFYTPEVTKRPENVSINYLTDIRDAADFAVRGYLSASTGYTTDLSCNKFTIASKNNNGQFGSMPSGYGGMVNYGYYTTPLHNYLEFFIDQTEGKYGKTVETGVPSVGRAFAPCLTNGITYNNIGSTDSTLNYAIARMKALILANPDKYYFTLTQNDGPTWYCDCEYCTESNSTYNHSGTLVRFMNKLIEALESTPELEGRDFKIITFAYGFTKIAPKGGVAVNGKLCIWYAHYQDSRYSITDTRQSASFIDDFYAWSLLTKATGATMSLWLYDTSFNNYLAYYPSTTINDAVMGTVKAAKDAGVDDIFILGAYLAENNWQAAMKTYIWSKMMWDTSLDARELQNEFVEAYFGPSAEKVKEYMSIYDKIYSDTETWREVCSGYNYYQYWWVSIDEHISALKAALEAVNAADISSVQNKSTYVKRANGVLASSYAAIIYSYEQYYNECHIFSGKYSYRTDYLGASSRTQSAGEARLAFAEKLKLACAKAGITKACEPLNTVQEWLDQYVSNGYG